MAKKSSVEKFQGPYGGELLKKRKGRVHGRPLSTKGSMHVVLSSSQAQGKKSFLLPNNASKIMDFVAKFALINKIQILSLAAVGPELHLQIKLKTKKDFQPFIRALTAAIAVAVGDKSRWDKKVKKFWDQRPFTRIVSDPQTRLTVGDYIKTALFEGHIRSRQESRMLI
jgi:hypothetical protein